MTEQEENMAKAISDFKGYIKELPKASLERRRYIRNQGYTCTALMGACVFKELDALIHVVMVETRLD